MIIAVCPLRWLDDQIATHQPDRVITLLAPGSNVPACPTIAPASRLTLLFNDIVAPTADLVPASRATVESLLAFTAHADEQTSVLVHCWAGISRSPAAAYIIACRHAEPGREAEIATALREASPRATPNALMVSIADDLLQREGRMRRAIAAIGRGAECGEGKSFVLRADAGSWRPFRRTDRP